MENNETKKGNFWIYAVIGVIVVALIVGGTYFLLKDKNDNDADPEGDKKNTPPTTEMTKVEAEAIATRLFQDVYDKLNDDFEAPEYSLWGIDDIKTYEGEEYTCYEVQSAVLVTALTGNGINYLLSNYFVDFDGEETNYYYCGHIDGLSLNEIADSIFSSTDVGESVITIDSFDDTTIVATVTNKNGTQTVNTAKLTIKYTEAERIVGGQEKELKWLIDSIEEGQ